MWRCITQRNQARTRFLLEMNRTFKLVALSSALFLTTSAFAGDVVLKMPYKTNVHVINDQRANVAQKLTDTSPFIFLKLHKGVNQVIFNYSTFYRQNGDDIFFPSNELIATFKIKQDGEYSLNLPKIKSSFEAASFLKTPIFSITDSDGNKIPLLVDTLRKKGVVIGRNFLNESRLYNLLRANKASARMELLNPEMKTQSELLERLRFLMTQSNQATRNKIIDEFSEK